MKPSQSKELIYLSVINSFMFLLSIYDNLGFDFNSGINHNILQNSSFSQELICSIL